MRVWEINRLSQRKLPSSISTRRLWISTPWIRKPPVLPSCISQASQILVNLPISPSRLHQPIQLIVYFYRFLFYSFSAGIFLLDFQFEFVINIHSAPFNFSTQTMAYFDPFIPQPKTLFPILNIWNCWLTCRKPTYRTLYSAILEGVRYFELKRGNLNAKISHLFVCVEFSRNHL